MALFHKQSLNEKNTPPFVKIYYLARNHFNPTSTNNLPKFPKSQCLIGSSREIGVPFAQIISKKFVVPSIIVEDQLI